MANVDRENKFQSSCSTFVTRRLYKTHQPGINNRKILSCDKN